MRLTDKGERWLANLIGWGFGIAVMVGFLAIWGFAGWVEAHP